MTLTVLTHLISTVLQLMTRFFTSRSSTLAVHSHYQVFSPFNLLVNHILQVRCG